MGNLPLHPAIVHLPIGLAIVIPLLAVGIAVVISKGLLSQRSWWIVVALQLLLLGSGVAALRTGESEEERVEHRIAEAAIEAHEGAAEQFLWVAGLTLGLATLAFAARSERRFRQLMAVAALATVLTAGMGVRVGHAGGELVYGPRGLAAQAPAATTAAAAGAKTKQARHDDD